jgi:hypothetical protein
MNDSFEQILPDSASNSKSAYIEIHALLEGQDDILWIATEEK